MARSLLLTLLLLAVSLQIKAQTAEDTLAARPNAPRALAQARVPGDSSVPPRLSKVVKHVDIYHVPGRFGGWPANHGLWSWGNEILVGFSVGYHKDLGPERHAIDREKPEEHWLARSLDGGESWTLENPGAKGQLIPTGKALHGIAPPDLPSPSPIPWPGPVDFTAPGFAMTLRMLDNNKGPSWIYYSTNKGHDWPGPFLFPNLGTPGIAARTDYLVNGPHDCQVFLTCAKANNEEGRVLCARTKDGGQSWQLQSYIGPEPEGYSIMPSTVRLTERELITTIRRRDDPKSWIDAYRSRDNGDTWEFLPRPVPDCGEGNPSSLIRLKDGRLCLSYGFRAAPFSMRARLSSDQGRSWSEDVILRGNGGGRDLGYPRSVQRPDGNVVTIYYFHDELKGERYVAATIWKP
jgi:hypothetical protein